MPARADAIVVLGCRILPSGRPTTTAERRVATAAEAYRRGVAPKVLASGGRRWGEHIEAAALARALVAAGVPEAAIGTELWSMTTYENAFYTAKLLRKQQIARVAIVTCAWHMPRALQNFEDAGLDPVPLDSPGVAGDAMTRAARFVHEAVAKRLDRRAMERLQTMQSIARPLSPSETMQAAR